MRVTIKKGEAALVFRKNGDVEMACYKPQNPDADVGNAVALAAAILTKIKNDKAFAETITAELKVRSIRLHGGDLN